MSPPALPEHLVPIDEEWWLWREFCVRGAGFPATDVLRLVCERSAALADRVLELEREATRAEASARSACKAALRASRERGEAEHVRRLSALLKRSLLTPSAGEEGLEAGLQQALHEARDVHARLQAARAELRAAFEQERVRTSEVLRETAREGRFREAITWQNRLAVRNGLEVLLRTPPQA